MTTVREIAEYAGVSKSTVSLVLNNKRGVSESMRATVMNAVHELQALRASELASADEDHSVATRYRDDVSVMVLHPPVLRSSYVFSEVLKGIQIAARMFDVELRLVVNDPALSSNHVSYLYLTDDALRPHGVLVFGASREEPLLDVVGERGIPCVVLGRDAKQYPVSGIQRDEVHHACVLTQHLLDLGHRRIAFVGGDMAYDYTRNRIAGYRQAMQAAGIYEGEQCVYTGDGATATAAVLSLADRITAIIYVNDSYAAEGIDLLRQRRVNIPEQISVASFDNTDFAQSCDPPLTSIAYDRVKEGQWAVKMLLDEIRQPAIQASYTVFKGELIVRGSTVAIVSS